MGLRQAIRKMIRPDVMPRERIAEISDHDLAILERAKPFTMTTLERQWALLNAVRHVVAREIPGDFVELGVWRGGSTMIAAMEMMRLEDTRTLWLYDTYEGMPEPDDIDHRSNGDRPAAIHKWNATRMGDGSDWCRASLEDVQRNIASLNYPGQTRFVVGKSEQTLIGEKPEQVSILRIDTDWYASTKASLEHLWDRLSPGGVLIMDDYGAWNGARVAADEFFSTLPPVFVHYLDGAGRLIVKD